MTVNKMTGAGMIVRVSDGSGGWDDVSAGVKSVSIDNPQGTDDATNAAGTRAHRHEESVNTLFSSSGSFDGPKDSVVTPILRAWRLQANPRIQIREEGDGVGKESIEMDCRGITIGTGLATDGTTTLSVSWTGSGPLEYSVQE